MPSVFVGTGFRWDAVRNRYRDEGGRLVSRAQVRQALDEAIDSAKGRIQEDSERLRDGEIDLAGWQMRMRRHLKSIHVMSGAAAVGGWDQATSADWSVVANRLKREYQFLDRFARDIEAGRVSLDAVSARAAMYGNAGSGTYEKVLRRKDMRLLRVKRERRLLHSGDPCHSCVTYAEMGWQEPGILPDIGEDCECHSNCRCTFDRETELLPKEKKEAKKVSARETEGRKIKEEADRREREAEKAKREAERKAELEREKVVEERRRAEEATERKRKELTEELRRRQEELERKQWEAIEAKRKQVEEERREIERKRIEFEQRMKEIDAENRRRLMERKAEEAKRRQEEAEKRKSAEEVERQRKAEAEERRRAVEEAERKRAVEEAERKRKEEDAKWKKAAEEARRRLEEEAKRKAEEAKRKAEEAERKAAEEAERKRKAAEEEEARKRKAEAEERKRKAEEVKKAAEEAERKRKAAEEEERRKRLKAEETQGKKGGDKKSEADEKKRLKAEEKKRLKDEEKRKAAEEVAKVKEREERVKAVEAMVLPAPKLIPPGKIEDRLKAYTLGDKKVEIIAGSGARLEELQAKLASSKARHLELLLAASRRVMSQEEKNELEAITKQRIAWGNEADAERKVVNQILLKVLAAKSPTELQASYEGGLVKNNGKRLDAVSSGDQKVVEAGLKWLGGLVESSPHEKYPVTKFGSEPEDQEQRAYCGNAGELIALSQRENVKTVIHEMGHAFEYRMKGSDGRALVERSKEFLKYRLGDEKPVKLRDVTGDAGYRDNEVGRKDQFDKAFSLSEAYYVGKEYVDATEVLSKGVEKIYADPAAFARKDPEYFKYVIGILDGSLR